MEIQTAQIKRWIRDKNNEIQQIELLNGNRYSVHHLTLSQPSVFHHKLIRGANLHNRKN